MRSPLKAVIPLVTVGVVTAVAVLGCTGKQSTATPSEPQVKSIEVSYAELRDKRFITRDVALSVGDTLQVTLASNPSTGFKWTADTQISDPSVIQQTSHKSVGQTSDLQGAPGTEVWTFSALKDGTATIQTAYNQPWPAGTKKAWTFTAHVAVL